jgi:3'(2'), 5'-bisphosphate nucleotidase
VSSSYLSDNLLESVTALGIAAAEAILGCCAHTSVSIKADGSPVTPADEIAEKIIREGLARLVPNVPVVSEEQIEHRQPAAGISYFLVDPLDGTREFIAGRNEYTVNIGLISGHGAERLKFSAGQVAQPEPIHTRPLVAAELVVMISRSHLDAATQRYLEGLPHTRRIGCGSSIKFCRLAEGSADHYPRLGPTHDWDVAAGHAILVAAGGSLVDREGKALAYGTPELRIPAFLAWGGLKLEDSTGIFSA